MRFPKDLNYFLEYGRLMKEALPADSPVHFVMRADVSWDMEQEFKLLKGVVNLWCCSGGILSFYRDAPKTLRDRGDVVWYYGGPPTVTENAAAITEFPLRAWLWGVNGYVHWLTVAPGEDPWFHFDGGGTVLVYSGDRFGIDGADSQHPAEDSTQLPSGYRRAGQLQEPAVDRIAAERGGASVQ